MGTYKRVVYEKVGDIPETKKGRKIQHDLDVLRTNVQTGKELLLFREESEKLYSPVRALNYLKKYKNLKEHKDLHNPSYIAAMQVCLRFFQCYDGPINGKWISTKLALKRFGKKYETKFGKVKGPYSAETLKTLEAAFKDNEKELDKLYHGYEDDNSEKSSSSEKNVSSKTSSQKQNSSSSSSSSSKSVSGSSSNSNSLSNNSSNTSTNGTKTQSNSTSQVIEDSKNQPIEKEQNQNVVQQPEQKVEDPVVQDTDKQKAEEQQTPETPKTEKTSEEVEREEIENSRKKLENTLKDINTTLTKYQQTLTKLETSINSLQSSSNDQTQKELVEYQKKEFLQQKEALEKNITTLQQQQTDLSNQLSTLLNEENITKVEIQEFQQKQLTPLQTQVDTFVRKVKKLDEDITYYQKELTPEKTSLTISPNVGQYFRELRTHQQQVNHLSSKPDLCASYALVASADMLKQQGIILPMPTEKSARDLSKTKSIYQYFDIKQPQTAENIKHEILNAPAGSIMTVRYARNEHYRGTGQPESRGVSHAMVSLGNGKYTDLISDNQRTIDLNNITIQSDPTWGFIFTDNQGRSFQFVTKTEKVTEGSGSSILTPKKSLEFGKTTNFDFDQLCSFHNIKWNQDVVEDFEASGQTLTNKIDAFAKQYHLDKDYVEKNVLVKKGNGKYNFRFKSKDIHLFVAWIRGYTGYGNNFIREKLYEKGMDWMKGGSPAGKRITLPSVNAPKPINTQKTSGGNGNDGSTGGTGERGVEQQAQKEQVQPISFKLKPEDQIKIRNLNIVTFESTVKENGFEAWKVLSDSKKSIIEFLSKFKDPQTNRPYNLTNREYDIIATKVMGVLFNESRIGAGWSPTSIGSSTGLSQLKWAYRDAEKLRPGSFSTFGINNKQDLEDVKKCAKATMIEMIAKYYTFVKPRVTLKRVDGEGTVMDKYNCFNYLYYAWHKQDNLTSDDPTKRCHPRQFQYLKDGNNCIMDFFGKVP